MKLYIYLISNHIKYIHRKGLSYFEKAIKTHIDGGGPPIPPCISVIICCIYSSFGMIWSTVSDIVGPNLYIRYIPPQNRVRSIHCLLLTYFIGCGTIPDI